MHRSNQRKLSLAITLISAPVSIITFLCTPPSSAMISKGPLREASRPWSFNSGGLLTNPSVPPSEESSSFLELVC